MPFDIVPMRVLARVGEPDELEQLLPLGRAAVGLRQALVELEQLVAGAPVREAEELGEVAELAVRRDRAGGLAADLGVAASSASRARRRS